MGRGLVIATHNVIIFSQVLRTPCASRAISRPYQACSFKAKVRPKPYSALLQTVVAAAIIE